MEPVLQSLRRGESLSREQLLTLLHSPEEALRRAAAALRQQHYGNEIFIRGLIEFTNHCKNDCYYCGIRCANSKARRYRLSEEQILSCCARGYELGLRTFVLQGGEDPLWTPDRLAGLVDGIKSRWGDCAVTLSVGEHPREVYRRWYEAGADRYILRHETADAEHYRLLHPPRQSLQSRMDCLYSLKEIGYQVGCGFMVGSPGQTEEHLVKDLLFLQEFQPHMVGIGPFIPQKDTPFGDKTPGSVALTLRLLSIVRLLLPKVLLPATTALGSLHPRGRELGFLAGANVCMPNLSPADHRKDYALYDNKLSDGPEAVESLQALSRRIADVGCQMSLSRGDHIEFERKHPHV